MTSFNNLIEITDKLDSLLSLIGRNSPDVELNICIGIAWDFNYDLRTKLFELKSDLATDEPLIAATRTQLYAPYDGGMTIAFRIQLARENIGLTEADLARLLNTYSDHISGWECGTTEPPASAIIPLANALKCDPLWLLTGNAPHQFPATPDHQSRSQYPEQLRSDASDHASHHVRYQSQA